MMRRRKFHQIVFLLAGFYNIAWGILSAMFPQWLFHFAGMEPMRYPEVFACLAMVIGLYGLLYLDVARRPEAGWLIVVVGTIGKLLGPIGWLVLVIRGDWPTSTLILCFTNDLIWLPFFALYLRDRAQFQRVEKP